MSASRPEQRGKLHGKQGAADEKETKVERLPPVTALEWVLRRLLGASHAPQ
jgi:hypothetical protein